jgi:plasmid maintenance system antidote protein VapI
MDMKKITQKELAERLEISQGHISDIIRGRRAISVSLACRIKKLTGMRLDSILCRDNPAKIIQEVQSYVAEKAKKVQ